jgi:hypothetical protein
LVAGAVGRGPIPTWAAQGKRPAAQVVTQAVIAEGSADPSGQRNRSGSISSIGLRKASRFRGRSLSSAATQSRSAALCTERSVPLGKYCLSNPLLFPVTHLHTLVPRQRSAQRPRQGLDLRGQRWCDLRRFVPIRQMHQHRVTGGALHPTHPCHTPC